MTSTDIIRALGGNVVTGMCCCPGHADHDPSLHVDPVKTTRAGMPLVKCHAGCSQDAVIAALRLRGLWPSKSEQPEPAADKKAESRRTAKAIWKAAAKHNTEPSQYLNGRGINKIPDNLMLLPRSEVRRPTGTGFPAMVAPVTKDGELCGVQLTFLTADGTKKVSGRTPRKSYGSVSGGCIELGKPDPAKPLIVGEGAETVLSAMQLAELPAGIAVTGAANMGKVKLPPCPEVIIAADRDDVGQQMARELARRLTRDGRTVRIAMPPR